MIKILQKQTCFASSTGSTVFFTVAVLLPALFLFFALSLDLSKVYSDNQNLQDAVDSAALLAAKSLPYKSAAENLAYNYLNQQKINAANHYAVSVAATTFEGQVEDQSTSKKAMVTVDVSGTSSLIFAKYFGLDSMPIRAKATAAVNPMFANILIDASYYMAPSVFTYDGNGRHLRPDNFYDTADGISWKDDLPASQLFFRPKDLPGDSPYNNISAESKPIYFKGSTDDEYKKIDPKILTQQCYNSSFTAMKKTAIQIYDYLSSFPLNSLGVMVAPSGLYYTDENLDFNKSLADQVKSENYKDLPFVYLREVGKAGFLKIDAATNNYKAEIGWSFFKDRAAIASDIYCYAMAEREPAYAIPNQSNLSGLRNASYPGTDRPNPAANSYLTEVSGSHPICEDGECDNNKVRVKMSHHNYKFLSTREVLWSLAARRDYRSTNLEDSRKIIDIYYVLRDIRRNLAGSHNRSGELEGFASNVVFNSFVLLGDAPHKYVRSRGEFARYPDFEVRNTIVSELRKFDNAAKRNRMRVNLFFIFFRHNGNPNELYCAESPPCIPFIDAINHLREHINNVIKGDPQNGVPALNYIDVHVLNAADENVLKDIAALLPLSAKAAVLM